MTTLVTGAAGFIGFHTCKKLLERGETVIGLDALNAYYDVNLKKARLKILQSFPSFHFHTMNIAQRQEWEVLDAQSSAITKVVHLAAQAGVRYSLENPYAYGEANLMGHLNVLEWCRGLKNLEHGVYASSSSVYGANEKLPFSVEDSTDAPISLYGATKKADELMSHAYSHLFGIPLTGLRFFTVYGPWGRPDMAAFIFTKAILEGIKIPVFNQGHMRRNFTYIDDVVQGILAILDDPKPTGHHVYNIGNSRSESLMDFIEILEKHLGRKAQKDLLPLQPGDVKETIADIEITQKRFGFSPKTHIEEGLKNFVHWYKIYYFSQ